MDAIEQKKIILRKIIKERAVISSKEERMVTSKGTSPDFVLDLRRIFLDSEAIDLIANIFWDIFEKEYPFYVGGQESGAIPLVTAIVQKGMERKKPIKGFFIRKQRKLYDLQRIIEGEVASDKKVILVDDLINSGGTIERQIKLLRKEGVGVDFVFALVDFGNKIERQVLKSLQEKRAIRCLFDLKTDLGVEFEEEKKSLPRNNFEIEWFFKGCNKPSFHLNVAKSNPAFDDKNIYFGTDEAIFWALNKKTGKISWKFKTGAPFRGKSISSSPAVFGDKVFFGSYDGNFYALRKEDGKLIWKFQEADAVHSSPCVSLKDGLIFVGLERNCPGRQGSVVALDIKNGQKKWEYVMREYVPSSPAYFKERDCVVIGCNDSFVYLFDAKTGKLKWKYKTGAEVKASFAFNEENNLIAFGSYDNNLYILDIDSGVERKILETEDLIYSTPLFFKNHLFFTSTDKNLYCYSLNNYELSWKKRFPGRIFSSPREINGDIFIGCSDGSVYEIDSASGDIISKFDAIERITNDVIYDKEEKLFFVSNYANEIYCLKYNLNTSKIVLEMLENAWRKFKES